MCNQWYALLLLQGGEEGLRGDVHTICLHTHTHARFPIPSWPLQLSIHFRASTLYTRRTLHTSHMACVGRLTPSCATEWRACAAPTLQHAIAVILYSWTPCPMMVFMFMTALPTWRVSLSFIEKVTTLRAGLNLTLRATLPVLCNPVFIWTTIALHYAPSAGVTTGLDGQRQARRGRND